MNSILSLHICKNSISKDILSKYTHNKAVYMDTDLPLLCQYHKITNIDDEYYPVLLIRGLSIEDILYLTLQGNYVGQINGITITSSLRNELMAMEFLN